MVGLQVEGLGFCDLRFRVLDLRLKVQGLGFWGLRLRV